MPDISDLSLAALVTASRTGDHAALNRMFPLVYDQLHRLAGMVRSGRSDESLGTTGLVHEAYLKLIRGDALSWSDRAHFLAIAARAMRQVLVDRATSSAAVKRGGRDRAVTLSDSVGQEPVLDAETLLDLDRALTTLATEHQRAAKVVECRYFGGMSAEETAEALGIAAPTVTRDWRFARAWLTRQLSA